MNNFVSFGLILFIFPICIGQECEKLHEKTYGEISARARYTAKKCWIIKVPEGSYVRIDIKELSFNSRPCSDDRLEISFTGTNGIYTYCSGNTREKPITSFSDVNIAYSHSQVYTYHYSNEPMLSSFRLNFSMENLICVQQDHFRCSPESCIHQYQVCNGIKDCTDGSDENGCEKGITATKGISVSRDNAAIWLKNQRSSSFGWGKNTHRGIIALYLAKAAHFTGENLEEELMVKQLELQTSVALLRNSTDPISVGELSMFVNALTVSCHNPRQFYGHDLLQILGERASAANSPSASAYLTLCNHNWTFTESDIQRVMNPLKEHSSNYPFISDVQAVAIMALTCMKNKTQYFRNIPYPTNLYENTIKKFIASQLSDGSFGNLYTTALITQALLASGQEDNEQWNVTATAHYLMKQLNSSSGNFLSTYLALPIFNGRSLADVATVNCSNIIRKQGDDNEISDVTNKLGGKTNIQYSLFVGDKKDVVHTIILRMPENSTAYDIMRVAQVADPKYKFLNRDVSGEKYVYDIAGITNDPEVGKFWLLYTEDHSEDGDLIHYTTSPDKVVLGDDEHLIMWYKTADI